MRLLHYSKGPLGKIRSMRQVKIGRFKPRGLWVSVEGEDDWKSWCEAENFNLDFFAHVTEVTLAENANILMLKGAAMIDAFTAEYYMIPESYRRDSGGLDWRGHWIDWTKAAERHSGIIIAPYVWARRLDGGAHWYYSWDCASGCIWDAKAISECRSLEMRAAAE